ncbi:hypothetical protein [Rhizobium phage RHph_X94]|uniref:hypothetical protein n=1 Tax=Thermoanaerobacter sp. CM-CNRG TB177 TaxID=2800659 RepID=UPI001AFC2FCE|nr:hypothetical protein EVB28_006 [Rhizobium phage RHph_TM23]QIG67236.1 hypothetical protein EVB36_006 [Rhizobium phage RHph_TM36]QIG67329.1 hypothetical protein EVB38_006 [Rhizobium phage RHph_TM3_3_5A]QIG67464.1 hypothetical protein EVB40_006 [Rhizobium phage RHph_TM3_3_14A]QIG67560.1 hypothetical protein EVB42_006 [Rhizobium phage RHph_TM1_10B]QIG67567.1 hypothetical protein EVB43_006 [Rhizobium phage RHph_TM3_3_4B]QIG67574.1 hypothetical protein EVB44_006 [Rhizobium phage RHph_TM3_3_5B]Q
MGKLVAGLLREVATPLLRRVGSVVAVALIAKGVSSDQATLLLESAGALLGISFDVAMILLNRGRQAR